MAGQPAAASLLPAVPARHGQAGRAAPLRQVSGHISIFFMCIQIQSDCEKPFRLS